MGSRLGDPRWAEVLGGGYAYKGSRRATKHSESGVKSSGSWCRVSARADCDGTTVNSQAGGGTVPEFAVLFFILFIRVLLVAGFSPLEARDFRFPASGVRKFQVPN